jgi:hypothetical protein
MRLGSDLANGGKGPFMSIDTKGGMPTFAAPANKIGQLE